MLHQAVSVIVSVLFYMNDTRQRKISAELIIQQLPASVSFFIMHLSQMLAIPRLTDAGGAGDAGNVTFQGSRTFLQILHEVEGMFICDPPTFTLNVWRKNVAALLKENDTVRGLRPASLAHT